MPVPSSINDLSTTAASNSPAGSESPALIDDYLRAFAAFIAALRDGKVNLSGSYADPAWITSLSGGKLTAGTVPTAALANSAVTPAKLSTGAPTWTSGGVLTSTGKLVVPTGSSATNLGIQFGSSTTGLWSYDVTNGDGLKVVVNGVVQASFGDTSGYNDIGYSWAQTVAASSGSIVPTLDWVNTRMNLGSGSLGGYAARAWVNFNGTGTVAIRSSGNVSSITDNGVGDYTVNFTTALPDANYAVAYVGQQTATSGVGSWQSGQISTTSAPTAAGCRIITLNSNTFADSPINCLQFLR